MRKKRTYLFRSFFTMRKSEQRGIAALLIILGILLLIRYFSPDLFPIKKQNFSHYDQQVETFLLARKKLKDSLHLRYLQKRGKLTVKQASQLLHPFPFNPNKLTVNQWVRMGLLRKQAQTITHYLLKGGYFYKKEDLKKIRGLSEAEYDVLKPYIQLSSRKTQKKSSPNTTLQKTDLNSVNVLQIEKYLHLPLWLSQRIIKYRNLLGGFYSPEQLNEVYGMNKKTFVNIKNYLVIDTTKIKKINLNTATFKQLLHHPYLNYENTKKLIGARERLHGFQTIKQAETYSKLPDTVWNKIQHYLYIRNFKK